MTAPEIPARRPRETGPVLLLLAVSLAFRLPAAAFPPALIFYDSDELMFLSSLLGLIGGETPNALQWPASTLFFAFLPIVLLHFLLTSPAAWEAVAAADPYGLASALALYLGEAFYDPASLLVPLRIVLAGVTSLTAPLVFRLLPERFSRAERLVTALVLASSPALVRQTAVVKGDSVGLLFWALALALVMARRDGRISAPEARRAVVGSALQLGLATASRLTHLIALPLLPVYAWWRGRREPVRLAALAATAFALPVLIFLPFLWTQPFTFLKAALGNVLLLSAHGSGGQSIAELTGQLAGLGGPLTILMAAPGLAVLGLRKRRPDLAALTLAAFFLFLLPLARSGYLPQHYALPLLPALALWAGVGTGALASWAAGRRAAAGPTVVTTLAVLVILANGLDVSQWLEIKRKSGARNQATEWIMAHTRDEERLALPISLAPLVPPNGRALEEILTRYREQPDSASRRLARLVQVDRDGWGAEPEQNFLLDAWLVDDEAIDVFRYRSMSHAARYGAAPPEARDVLYYQPGGAEPSKPDRLPRDRMLEQLRAGGVDLMLADSPLSPSAAAGLQGREGTAGWWIYRRATDSGIENVPTDSTDAGGT